MSMKNSNYTIGNRTRDLPACRTVPHSNISLTIRQLIISYGNYKHQCYKPVKIAENANIGDTQSGAKVT
jgi:hypothetical protein